MKKFGRIMICLLICVFTFGLAACVNTNGKDGFDYPTSAQATYGNSGLAVSKGDYLYFVNGYQSADDMTEKNASYDLGALMVAKLDENGNVILNDDDLLDDEYYVVMSNLLCGFEATDLYIFGDYLYFTSPCQQDDTSESWAKTRVDFNRIRLNKSGKVERLYQSEVANSNLEYKYYDNNGTYLLVYEKSANLDHSDRTNAIYRIDAASKDKKEIARNVSSIVMNDDNAFDSIFYVVDNATDSEYTMNRYNIATDTVQEFCTYGASFEVKFIKGDYVYIIQQETDVQTERLQLKRASISNNAGFTPVCYSGLYDDLYLTPNGEMVIALKTNSFEYYRFSSTTPQVFFKDADATSVTVIGFANGSIVYIDNNNAIKMASYSDCLAGRTVNINTIATVENINTTYFDIDENFVYFYKTVNSNNYLFRLSINNNPARDTEEMIGVYLTDDIPETETEEEE